MSRISRDIEEALGARRRSAPLPPALKRASAWITWTPLVVLPGAVVSLREAQPAWLFMWTLAFAIFIACKWLTWWQTCLVVGCPGTANSFAYLFGWVGMDAEAFCRADQNVSRPKLYEWLSAAMKTCLGGITIWMVARRMPNPTASAWAGMLGTVLLLHFGLFQLLALIWRQRGFNAMPLMRAPLFAHSLSEFWNTRWNAAFHSLAKKLLFAPLARLAGARVAMLGTFVASGIVHDLVISLPANGGFGFPTLYFALQGVGVLVERSQFGVRAGLRGRWRGKLFLFVIAAAPVGLLFHQPFIHNVMIPFLEAVDAL